MRTKLIILLVFFIAISISAQPQRPRFGLEQFEPNKMLEHLSEQLSLTDEQVEEIEPILYETQNKLKELKNHEYATDKEMMEEHRAVMEMNAELIEKYLNEQQIEKFREIREQRLRLNGDRSRMGRNRW